MSEPRFKQKITARSVRWLRSVTVEVPEGRDEVIVTVDHAGFSPQVVVIHHDEKLCGESCRYD